LAAAWAGADGDVEWILELDRADLIPGRLVAGRVRMTARDDVRGRAVVVTLRGEERWKYEVHDGKTSRVVEDRADLPAVPMRLAGPIELARGESLELPFELPVPALGPPTIVADNASVEWSLEAKLDRDGFDSSLEVPLRVLQPTALLRAGVVHVGMFALFADAAGDDRGDVSGAVALDPVPLVAGASFTGRVRIDAPQPVRVRGVRCELKVTVEVTDPKGLSDELVVVRAELATPTTLEGSIEFGIEGILDPDVPPTAEMRHSRVSARFELILDRAFAPDQRLVREVAIAGTAEL
jgi:hypothetical protein